MNVYLNRSLSKGVLTHSLPGLSAASDFGCSTHPISVSVVNVSD